MLAKTSLILGGASSGKSAFAEGLITGTEKPAIYIATAQAGDGEMSAKIARHRQQRGGAWQTLEIPLDVADALGEQAGDRVVLLDCATIWLSNQMHAEHDLAVEQGRLIEALRTCAAPVVVVSNEVGLGGVPANALARRFGQAQGALNIALAGCSDLVVNVVAGLPQVLKGRLPK